MTYQGALCIGRFDWKGDALRTLYVGHVDAPMGKALVERWEAMLRTSQSIVMFVDAWDMTGYESGFRLDSAPWAQKHPTFIREAHFVTRSKIVSMVASVVGLAVPGIVIKSYAKRAEFDVLAKKAGFPLNPPLPQLAKPA